MQRPAPLVTASTREVLQQITWLAIFQIKLVLIWMLSKKYLRPGEDYSVYKSKTAASICNGTFFFKSWFDNPPFRIEFTTTVKTRQDIKAQSTGSIMNILKCPSLWWWGAMLACLSPRKPAQQMIMTGSYVNRLLEPDSWAFMANRSPPAGRMPRTGWCRGTHSSYPPTVPSPVLPIDAPAGDTEFNKRPFCGYLIASGSRHFSFSGSFAKVTLQEC